MKRLPSVNENAKSAVAGYMDSISVPAYRAAAVESRRNDVAPKRRDWSRAWMSVAAGIAAIALVAFAPAVVAQVQRVMQAFTVVNGRATELTMQQVSLQQLRADMPFAVVRPGNVPPGYEEEIDEIGPGTNTARAMFHYAPAGRGPALTVIESSAADQSPVNFRVEFSTRGETPAMQRPVFWSQKPLAPGPHVVMKDVRNGVGTVTRVTPITWVTHGTRITVIPIPGALTRMQLEAILRSMR